MKFSYSAIWADAVAAIRAHAPLLVAVAGVFLFFPSLLTEYLAPQPEGEPSLATMMQYFRENRWLLLMVSTIGFVGNLTILILVLDDGRPTVGSSIQRAFGLLPTYFFASILSGLIMIAGLVALIIPGLYLAGRLSSVGPAIVAEPGLGAVQAIKRSFALSKGRGWAILGLILIVVLTFYVVRIAVIVVLGSLFLLIDKAGGGGVGAFLLVTLDAALGAAFATVLVVLIAAIYRRLASAALPVD